MLMTLLLTTLYSYIKTEDKVQIFLACSEGAFNRFAKCLHVIPSEKLAAESELRIGI